MTKVAGPPTGNQMILTWADVDELASMARERIGALVGFPATMYPVPTGGIYAAQAILAQRKHRNELQITDSPKTAQIIVDDLIDSGKTREDHRRHSLPFLALLDKLSQSKYAGKWITFPWEHARGETGAEDAVVRLLQFIGENPKRPGLLETPARVIKSYGELFAGYSQDPKALVKVFEEVGHGSDEMIVLKGAEFYSMCEHHMLPFFGRAHIAYIPRDGKVMGLSKLARVLDVYARRLQVQERLTHQVADFLYQGLSEAEPFSLGSACMVEATHLCVCGRGVGKQGSTMVTSALRGVFFDPAPRAEFFNLIGG